MLPWQGDAESACLFAVAFGYSYRINTAVGIAESGVNVFMQLPLWYFLRRPFFIN